MVNQSRPLDTILGKEEELTLVEIQISSFNYRLKTSRRRRVYLHRKY